MRLILNKGKLLTKAIANAMTDDKVLLLKMPQYPAMIENTENAIPTARKKNIATLVPLWELAALLIALGKLMLLRVIPAGSPSAMTLDMSKVNPACVLEQLVTFCFGSTTVAFGSNCPWQKSNTWTL